jgi:hypothetical protein
VTLCQLLPIAPVALAINALSLWIGNLVLSARCDAYVDRDTHADDTHKQALKSFAIPLAPGVAYYALRGQLSLALLSVFGSTQSVAYVGALGRLSQVLALVGLANSFLVQPHFARLRHDRVVKQTATWIVAVYVSGAMLLVASSVWWPEGWLLILGSQYEGVRALVPLAVSIPLVAQLGDILYVLLTSRRWTSGQNYTIYLGVTTQVLTAVALGVDTAQKALVLSLTTAGMYTLVQAALLARAFFRADPQRFAPYPATVA